jgi:mRNA-degrading endonuclease YafQ of YafQ-DinJ toxin-antitoxin module
LILGAVSNHLRGDYRIIYRIDEQAHALLIVTIDHRADSYRPRSPGRAT